jgi:hypothetical protein
MANVSMVPGYEYCTVSVSNCASTAPVLYRDVVLLYQIPEEYIAVRGVYEVTNADVFFFTVLVGTCVFTVKGEGRVLRVACVRDVEAVGVPG